MTATHAASHTAGEIAVQTDNNTSGQATGLDRLKSVLLVEGSSNARKALVTLLGNNRSRPVKTSEVEDGVAALCSLGTVKPDAVLMNIRSARLDGFQTCALIKNSDVFRDVRVVLLSDQECLLEKTRAELVGADAFLVRPFRRIELEQALCGSRSEAGTKGN